MTKLLTIVLALLLLDCLNIVLSQQNNLSQCRIVCDEEQRDPEPEIPYPIPKRGRKGQKGEKGEKGDVGSPGQLGDEYIKEISENARNIKNLEIEVNRQFKWYVEKKSRKIDQNALNFDVLYGMQKDVYKIIDELSMCEIEQIENASFNVTGDSENLYNFIT